MEMLEIMKQRHSVRQYTSRKIESEKRLVLDEMIKKINQDTKLNIQIIYDEPKCFDSFMAHYGKFKDVSNYIALVGKKSSNLESVLGYYGEKLVLKAQELGLNTCWVAMTHGESKAVINKGEKLVCIIAIGYGVNQGAEHKIKPLEKVCNYYADMPEWFLNGVNAALLAPTAMNQQKFYFELLNDGTVKLSRGKGFYSKVDLGIAKYHFEMISNRAVNIK